jgi:hypothetical protein
MEAGMSQSALLKRIYLPSAPLSFSWSSELRRSNLHDR